MMNSAQPIKIDHFQRPIDLIDIANRGKDSSADRTGPASFKEMFSRELAASRSLSFSKHAQERMFSRGIELSSERVNQIADAVDKAQTKGSKETLILADEAAFIVAVDNRTVITVFDRDNLREGVVTSIDSAVIL